MHVLCMYYFKHEITLPNLDACAVHDELMFCLSSYPLFMHLLCMNYFMHENTLPNLDAYAVHDELMFYLSNYRLLIIAEFLRKCSLKICPKPLFLRGFCAGSLAIA